MKKLTMMCVAGAFAVLMAGCSPEVGSEAWCENMDETPTGEWSANDAGDYAKHCVFR